MKTKIFIALAFIFYLVTPSCTDFLDEDPKGRLTPNTFFSSQDELNMGVNSLYEKVMNTQTQTNPMLPRWTGDDMTTNPGSNKQAAAEFDAFAPADNNKGVTAHWNTHYTIIKAANYLIQNAERTPTTPAEINIAIGQAKYWRAYAYFMLVRVFGPIPVNLTGEINYDATLSTVSEVYAQIVKDLQECETLLPTSFKGQPRVMFGANAYITQQAAKATLSSVYMAMAGWPLNLTENYAKAAAKAKEVIDGVNSGEYEYILEPDFKNVYAPSYNYSLETVVGINFQKSFTWWQDSQLTSSNLFESLGGWGDAWGEIRFWKRMPEGPRKDAIYNPKILLNNKAGNDLIFWWEKNENGVKYIPEYHPMFSIFTVGKGDADYDYTKPASLDMTNSHRHRVIRYSEVLLWYAESQARADGTPNALAYECVNKVRNRAGLGNMPTGMNGTDFANEVVAEHGWEIAGYYCALVTRRDDQMRMELLQATFNERATNAPVEVAPGVMVTESVPLPQKTWSEKLVYAPYPATDASLNPNLVR